jgi:hypothetical protein
MLIISDVSALKSIPHSSKHRNDFKAGCQDFPVIAGLQLTLALKIDIYIKSVTNKFSP